MAERTLLLLRHAKSSWDEPALEDAERPLAPRGRRAAAAIGKRLARRGPEIDYVLCSPSQRTRETLALLGLPEATRVRFEPKLYLASARALLTQIRGVPARTRCLLVIAHDPGLDHLVRMLAPEGRPKALRRVAAGFPTGALAELRFERRSWKRLDDGSAFLRRFTRPRDLA
ncbi:MAG: histidine phosphatase family protein [Myxococcota bacterium]